MSRGRKEPNDVETFTKKIGRTKEAAESIEVPKVVVDEHVQIMKNCEALDVVCTLKRLQQMTSQGDKITELSVFPIHAAHIIHKKIWNIVLAG